MKVGVADGGVDVTQVIAAIDWVVQHRNDNGLNIRVINLSYGTNSPQATGRPALLSPSSRRGRRASWSSRLRQHRLPASAGAPGLADPAYNPFVIAAGGYDTKGTAASDDDTIGAYSASSDRLSRHQQVQEPGLSSPPAPHVQGLRVPNGVPRSKAIPRGDSGRAISAARAPPRRLRSPLA